MLLAIAAVLAAAVFVFALGSKLQAGLGWLVATLPAGLFALFLVAGFSLEGAGAIVQTHAWVPSLGIEASFRLDGFSLLFALLITGIGTLVIIFANAYFAGHADQCRRFLTLILVFMAAMLGTVLADNLVVMFVFWEATSLVSFMLIGFHSARPEARKAALQSLIVTAGGGLALFAGILLIGMEFATFSMSEIASRADELAASPNAMTIMVLVLLGAFTKSAQVPFHFWLPNAMEAPSPASAYLHSATMVKLGVYLLARFDQAFAGMPAFGTTLVIFGTLTFLVACARALSRSGYKAILAQSTVASLGVLVMLIGLDGELASVAVVGFILSHALYKAALFFCAGTAIHATDRTDLTEINGLAHALPFTAGAALLAAIAMAGLPPTFSFIAKEYLFEAQIESGFGWLVIAAAVAGSAVFVAIAFIVALRPFFLGRERAVEAHHGETPGLYLGPIILAALGLFFGLFPGILGGYLVNPAASALAGTQVNVSLSLWHGFTPMLALSGVVVGLGILIYLLWPRLLARMIHVDAFDTVLGDAGYHRIFNGIMAMARRSTVVLQSGDQRLYTAIVVAANIAITLGGVLVAAPAVTLDLSFETFRIAPAILLGLMAGGAITAIATRSLVACLVCVGIVGFGSALLFLMNGAPDLALTQFSVEVLIVVILIALLLRLPVRPPSTRSAGEQRVDIALSAMFAAIVFVALAAMTVTPLDLRLTEYFADVSYREAFGRNVVNVILVDFRAIDTLGEIAVVSFAAIGVWAMLRRRGRAKEPT